MRPASVPIDTIEGGGPPGRSWRPGHPGIPVSRRPGIPGRPAVPGRSRGSRRPASRPVRASRPRVPGVPGAPSPPSLQGGVATRLGSAHRPDQEELIDPTLRRLRVGALGTAPRRPVARSTAGPGDHYRRTTPACSNGGDIDRGRSAPECAGASPADATRAHGGPTRRCPSARGPTRCGRHPSVSRPCPRSIGLRRYLVRRGQQYAGSPLVPGPSGTVHGENAKA